MCCVMPPASRSATRVSRMASSSDVLPWSTWPMTVTTGARSLMSSGLASSVSAETSSSSKLRISISAPNSRAMSLAVSTSSVLLMVIIMRFISSLARTSFTRTSSLSARSFTVIPSARVMVRVIGGGAAGADGVAGAEGRSRRGRDRALAGAVLSERRALRKRRPRRRHAGRGGRAAACARAATAADAVRRACSVSSAAAAGDTAADAPGAPGRARPGPDARPARGPRGRAGRRRGAAWRTIRAWLVCGRLAGASGRAGCGVWPGSSMRSRSVGGTNRPGAAGGRLRRVPRWRIDGARRVFASRRAAVRSRSAMTSSRFGDRRRGDFHRVRRRPERAPGLRLRRRRFPGGGGRAV